MTDVLLEPWMTKAAAAAFFGCSVRSIEYALKAGCPHAVIFGRPKVKASEVEAWLEQNGQFTRHASTEVDRPCYNGCHDDT